MTGLSDALSVIWGGSGSALAVNMNILTKLLGALCLGVLVGYERFYHGHAAGMRTYGLVCMASAGLVAIAGYPAAWFGGLNHTGAAADLTRIIQGIVTGIGFLGAGLIVHEQFTTRGLTSAASIWASSVIGILVGVGFYPAAIALTLLSALCMVLVKKIEFNLPAIEEIAVMLEFSRGSTPDLEQIRQLVKESGYDIARRTLSIISKEDKIECHFILVALDRPCEEPIAALSAKLASINEVIGYKTAYARS